MYCDVLDTLEHGPLKNVCSPPLMGASGVVPMTTISLYVPAFPFLTTIPYLTS